MSPEDKPEDKPQERTVTIELGLIPAALCAAALVLTWHISHDWLYLACMRDGHHAAVCIEFADQDSADVDGRGLARVLLDAVSPQMESAR